MSSEQLSHEALKATLAFIAAGRKDWSKFQAPIFLLLDELAAEHAREDLPQIVLMIAAVASSRDYLEIDLAAKEASDELTRWGLRYAASYASAMEAHLGDSFRVVPFSNQIALVKWGSAKKS